MKISPLNRVINSIFITVYSSRFILFAVSALAISFLLSSSASARLSGEASLTYSKYDGSDKTGSRSSSSLLQNYSLLYASSGPVYNSRVGSYNVSLGYNFTAVDSSFNFSDGPGKNYNESIGKLLYLGELKLDPKEVPFKLKVYSHDMSRNFVDSSNGLFAQGINSIIGGNEQAIGVSNGIHLESGATLVAGVKNGMTNGYNEILRHFPMILIDYRDIVNRDLRSAFPIDNRLSRLAFVSLNKKDNWFHYRHTQYVDNIDSESNYEENQFQLGTVDQNMARRWIDFSNWIKVSTDLQISTRKHSIPPIQTEEINLNLFVSAERKNWNARSFSSFSRYIDESKNLSYQKSVPLYFSGVVDNDTSWNARASYRDSRDIGVSGAVAEYTSMLLGYRVNTFKRAPFTLSHSFDVESSAANTTDILTLSGGLETASSDSFSRVLKLAASYNIRNTSASSSTMTRDSTVAGSGSDFLMQQLVLSAGYIQSNTLRYDLKHTNNFTRGKQTSFGGETQLSAFSVRTTGLSTDIGSSSYTSSTVLTTSWNPKPRLNISFSLSEEISKSDVQPQINSTKADSQISFANSVWDVKNKFGYTRSNGLENTGYGSTVSNETTLKYIHNRHLNSNANIYYSSVSSQGENTSSTSFGQGLSYSYFTTSGIARPIFEFTESLRYSVGKPKSVSPSRNAVALGFRYFPISRLTLAGGIAINEFRFSNPFNDALVWNASVAANFKLMQASVDYVSAFRNTDKVRERKITGNIRKAF